jgi:tetratricopeptide (TPR) repeat protein
LQGIKSRLRHRPARGGPASRSGRGFAGCRADLPLDPAPHLNLASALLALARPSEAVDAARRARRRAPKLPQAHYMLGLAQLAAGRLDQAAAAFSDCLRLAPGFAAAWVNLGIVRYRKSDIEGAKNAMRRALARQRDRA